ncbi:MAG TPA: IPT/TIG domain-containing protein, partial [Longimicrobiales bacterium]|nr:IPT/TIG domain-containing protein [Longimicrobiales bacterium]
RGVASNTLKLGDLGTYTIEATAPNLLGATAKFTAKAVDAPAITTVSNTSPKAGDTITINGTNFSPTADENIVLFGGFRGKVITATTTQLRVVVPLCVPTRTQVAVQAMLGAVSGNQTTVSVVGSSTVSALQLTRGEVRLFSDPNELGCFRLPGGVSGLTVVMIPQNISQVVGSITPFEITGQITNSGPLARPTITIPPHTQDFASAWELRLRAREQQLFRNVSLARPQPSLVAACGSTVVVGNRCDFSVINKDDKFETVTAEVKAVGTRAVIYQDIKAPANGLTAADFTALVSQFDDPIYTTDIATYGPPSDIDSNGRIIILLTPVVNSLTPRGSNGFIAGFFYACDLVSRSACSGTNSAEVFYALTADPGGTFGDARSRDGVIRALPPVLAHEFQHMINFGQRNNNTIDALWLSEGMAHNAEDVVGDEYERRGDVSNAALFRSQNTNRGNRYLRATATTSLLSEEDVSLELRGGGWLFVKYLEGRYGKAMLQKLTQSTLSSVANVTTQTGRSWSGLLSDFAVALYADDNPELVGATVNPIYSFPNMNIRNRLGNFDGSYPIRPTVYGFADFMHRETLEASSHSYVQVQAGVASNTLSLTFTGQRGGAFAINAAPQMTVMRIR